MGGKKWGVQSKMGEIKDYFKTIWQIYKYSFFVYTIGFWMYFVYDDFQFILRAIENLHGMGDLLFVWFVYYMMLLTVGSIVFIGLSLIGLIIFFIAIR